MTRFVDPEKGPVVSLKSSPYPGLFNRRFWHSTARLHPDCGSPGMKTKVFEHCTGGWSRDKETSQCKAVAEAIERWAYRRYYSSKKEAAGLDVDPTSNGFAALPAVLGAERLIVGAYCESLERWALGRMWDCGDIPLLEVSLWGHAVTELFRERGEKLHCFGAKFRVSPPDQISQREVFFNICIIETGSGGAVPGSACGEEAGSVIERAATEAFINLTAFKTMSRKKISSFEDVLESRLHFFGSRPNGYKDVMSRICSAGNAEKCKVPDVIFSKRLSGPWEPEVLVHRVLLGDSKPVTYGGEDRFVI